MFWEELAAANKSAIECCDKICRQIKESSHPFGGIPFIGIGDFHQIPPIVKTQAPPLQASIKFSSLWPHFSIHSLRYPHRTASDPEYTNLIDHIGEDYLQHQPSLQIIDYINNIEDVCLFLFSLDILQNPFLALKRASLSPRNIYVDEFNENILQHLPGVMGTSLSPFFT